MRGSFLRPGPPISYHGSGTYFRIPLRSFDMSKGSTGALRTYIIYFRFTKPGEKKPANVSHYKLSARDAEEARELARQYANYPGIEIVDILPA